MGTDIWNELSEACDGAFPFRVGPTEAHLVEAVCVTENVAITIRLITFDEAGGVQDVMEQQLDLGDVDAARLLALVDAAKQRLATSEYVPMPQDLFRLLSVFVPVGPFATEGKLWYQDVVTAIDAQAKEAGFDERHEQVADWALAPRTVYYLWLADYMLGSSGIQGFLSQQDVEDVTGVLEALDQAPCSRLAERYRQGLGLAADEGLSEFLMYVDEDWLDVERRDCPQSDAGKMWTAIDHHDEGGTYWLLKHELEPALRRYIDEHRNKLVSSATKLSAS